MSVSVSVRHRQGTGAGISVSMVQAEIRWECRCQYGPGRGLVPVSVSVPVSVQYEQEIGAGAGVVPVQRCGSCTHTRFRPAMPLRLPGHPCCAGPHSSQVRGRPSSPLPAPGTGCGSETDEAAGPSSSPGQRRSLRAAGPSPSPKATRASSFFQDTKTITTPKVVGPDRSHRGAGPSLCPRVVGPSLSPQGRGSLVTPRAQDSAVPAGATGAGLGPEGPEQWTPIMGVPSSARLAITHPTPALTENRDVRARAVTSSCGHSAA